jgi:hypothetical protein
VLTGALFGIAVFFVMNLVVLPLSAFPHIVTFKQPAVTFISFPTCFFSACR